MSFLAPWFLAGLAALVPLVLLHLRRQRREVGVASLRLWRDLPGVATPRRRRARVVRPAQLALQALLLVLVVLALAAPQVGGGSPDPGAAPFVAVVDGSTRMAMTDVTRDRLDAARQALDRRLAALPGDTPVSVVVAGASPRLVVSRVSPDAARDALGDVRADAPSADLAAGLRLAGGELHRAGGTVALLHAEVEPAPRVRAFGLTVDVTAVGDRADNQALVAPVARCSGDACTVLTGVRNEAGSAVDERLIVERDGREIGARSLTVAPRTTADVEIAAEPGNTLVLRLDRADALPDDNEATVAVPDPDTPLDVALVARDAASAVARGLAALPGVRVRRVAPGGAVGDAGLVVYDRVAPPQATAARETLVVAPPSLPGGRVGAALVDPTLTGSIPGTPLLAGVDFGALVVERGGVRRVSTALPAVAWAADGPLLSDDGRTTLLTIDPARSNLTQLPAFPVLLANIVDRARGLSPTPAAVAEPASVTLRATDGGALAPAEPTDLWPWLVGAALLVLVLETALAAEWHVPSPQRREHATRLVVGLLLLAALVWPHVGGEDRESTVLVVDRSASIDDAQAAQQREWIAAATDEGVCGDPCRIVAFGGQATFAGAGAERDVPVPDAQATDLHAALTLAAASADRAIVLSDGFPTTGASSLPDRRVDAVPLDAPDRARDAAVTRLVAGSPLHAGDPLTLQATISSTVAANARVELSRDGAPIGRQTLALRAGQTPLVLTPDPPDEGWHTYRLRVQLDGDEQAANDTLVTTTRIGPPPTVLVVGEAGAVPALLTADGMQVRTGATLPTSFAGVDLVLLGDLPADQLSDAQQRGLRAAVEQGLGLFVLGGEHSLSLGGYAGTPLDAILPVQSLKPGGVRKRKLALELVIDRSSSMNDLAGAGTDPKIAMARAAAQSALTLAARDEDELGIVAFDAQPHDVLPLQRVTAANTPAVGAQIDTLDAGGGTNVLRGLQRGADQIAASRAPTRHIVLISDGVSEPGDPAALLRRLNDDRITLSTIALGPDADVELLRRLARDGRGTFVAVPDARDLPRVLARETRRVAPAVAQRAPLTVTPGAASPITSALSGQALPALAGTVLTQLRDGAIAPLTARVNTTTAPVLAQWQVELGRVAVWTPGAGAFAGEWPSRRPQLFTAAARWVERGVPTPALEPALDAADPSRVVVDPLATAGEPLPLADVTGTVRAPDGATSALDFAAVAPSRYAASLGDDPAAGVYGTGVSDGSGDAQALLAVPYPVELSPRPADASVLAALADASGGEVLSADDPHAALRPDDGFPLWRVLLAAALLVFFAAVAASMRRAR